MIYLPKKIAWPQSVLSPNLTEQLALSGLDALLVSDYVLQEDQLMSFQQHHAQPSLASQFCPHGTLQHLPSCVFGGTIPSIAPQWDLSSFCRHCNISW